MYRKIFLVNYSITVRTFVNKTREETNLILSRQNLKPGCTKILHKYTSTTNKNNYFPSVALNNSSEIPHTDVDFRSFLQDYNLTDTSILPPLIPSEIKEITLGLKSTGGGHLEIPIKIFKMNNDLISVPL